jgi:hypothetical protein
MAHEFIVNVLESEQAVKDLFSIAEHGKEDAAWYQLE